MASSPTVPTATTQEYEDFIARVRRSNAETEKFIAEHKKLMAEAAKFERDRVIAPYSLIITGFAAGAAMVGAVAAMLKFLGP